MLSMLELCAGYGGFSLAFAGVARSVCFVERDAHAASVLVARMQDGALPQAPIWDDLSTFDGRPWRGRVDLVTAGKRQHAQAQRHPAHRPAVTAA